MSENLCKAWVCRVTIRYVCIVVRCPEKEKVLESIQLYMFDGLGRPALTISCMISFADQASITSFSLRFSLSF